MAERTKWTFTKPAHELADAASKRGQYHLERLGWWEGELEKAEEDAHSRGLIVHSHDVTGGQRHDVTVDPVIAKRMGECSEKIRRHGDACNEYAQWVNALKAADVKSFELDFSDWIFFFGLHGDEDE